MPKSKPEQVDGKPLNELLNELYQDPGFAMMGIPNAEKQIFFAYANAAIIGLSSRNDLNAKQVAQRAFEIATEAVALEKASPNA